MTAALAAPPSHRLPLTLATLLVMGAHAWLVLGLPSFKLPPKTPGSASTLLTRMIEAPAVQPPAPSPPAPPPEASPPEEPPAPATAQAAPPRPEPKRQPPKPRPRKTARPKAAPAATPSTATAQAPDSAAAPTSLLAAPPIGSFGGGTIAHYVTPLLSDAEADAALATIERRGDADTSARLAPSAHLTFDTRIEAHGSAFQGKASLIWRQDGRLYDANWSFFSPRLGKEDSAFSSGLVTPSGLAPLYTRLHQEQTQEMRFDYAAGQIHAHDAPMALPSGAQDRLSVLLQLGAMLAAEPQRYPVGSAVTVTVASPEAATPWRFTIEAEEAATALNGTPVQATLVIHRPRDADAPRLQAWLAHRMEYLPVRLQLTYPDGTTIDHVARQAIALPIQPPPAHAKPRPGAGTPSSSASASAPAEEP
ncbi:DUF3108 domain-containing protein [Comamonadaceae bacterium OH2545_COT-014]|nr:DUF3108 domain-containing protein [Comamonadaceae bacterium OH2545_COT-014]